MSDAAPILDLLEAFRRSKTLFTAVQLGIFDQLASAPQTAADVALDLNLDRGACARLLDGCVSLALLTKEESRYANTALAERYLVGKSPDTLANYINYSDQSLYPLWGQLSEAVRQGTNRWQQVFGNRNGLFDHYFRDPDAARAFLGGMHGLGQLASERVVTAFDLSSYRTLVDLGGATGHLAIAACRQYPQLTATVFDLPLVARYARETLAATDLSSRIAVVEGDFFLDDLPVGDLYYLGRILHDWSDSKILKLLERIFAILPKGGALLIGETLVKEDRSGPSYSLMQDLNMLVCTEGRERTPSEYQSILKAVGFSQIQFGFTGSLIDAILATGQLA